jgi:hypothetical protein
MSASKEQEIKQTEKANEIALSGLESLGAAAEAVEEAEDSEDFDIPQRFTKSGRKRAVPFPLKVSVYTFFRVERWQQRISPSALTGPRMTGVNILQHLVDASLLGFRHLCSFNSLPCC